MKAHLWHWRQQRDDRLVVRQRTLCFTRAKRRAEPLLSEYDEHCLATLHGLAYLRRPQLPWSDATSVALLSPVPPHFELRLPPFFNENGYGLREREKNDGTVRENDTFSFFVPLRSMSGRECERWSKEQMTEKMLAYELVMCVEGECNRAEESAG